MSFIIYLFIILFSLFLESVWLDSRKKNVKWTLPLDFELQVFSMNQFLPRPQVSHKGCLNFFRKFVNTFAGQGATLACWHRWQMEKIFNQKTFNYFVWILLDVSSLILIPFVVSGGKIYRWCHWYRWQICHWCSWHRLQICRRVCWHLW